MSIKRKIINSTANVLSFPARALYGHRGAKATAKTNIIKQARKFENAANFDSSGMPTDAFKYRTQADAIRRKPY